MPKWVYKKYKKDIFTKYDYIGEIYGEYNYFLSKTIRDGFIQKINTDKIVLTLNSPNLGITRGSKLNFIRYVNDEKIENKMKNLEKNETINRNVKTNIPLEEYEIENDGGNGKYIIDKTVSGQYFVYSTSIKFNNKEWQYDVTLIRDMKDKLNANILLEDE